jgi:hypothetical protein
MTIRNRERKVHVHAPTRVYTYSSVSAGTRTKPASPVLTNRHHRAPRPATNRGSHRA